MTVDIDKSGSSNEDMKWREGQSCWQAFEGTVPVPMVVSSDIGAESLRYGNERPWFFMGDT